MVLTIRALIIERGPFGCLYLPRPVAGRAHGLANPVNERAFNQVLLMLRLPFPAVFMGAEEIASISETLHLDS